METLAPFIGVTDHLAAQWFVPAFVGPFMIVAHVACLRPCSGTALNPATRNKSMNHSCSHHVPIVNRDCLTPLGSRQLDPAYGGVRF